MAVPTIYIVADYKTVVDTEHGGYAVVKNFTQHHDRLKAEARYHQALASAANSETVERWCAIIMTNDGTVIASDHYDHEVTPEQPEQPAE